MNTESLNQLCNFYLDTLQNCGVYLLNADSEKIIAEIFEQFDYGITTFFEEENLKQLLDAGYISTDKMNKSTLLRDKVFELQTNGEWNIEVVKTSANWRAVMELSDEVKMMR